MPRAPVNPNLFPCSSLLFEGGIAQYQLVSPDRFLSRARDTRGRFARGHSGNPRGRPPGIRNPKRRVPDLVARPLSPDALSTLLDRKPHLLRPLMLQLLPPPLPPPDPAERLGIDLSAIKTSEDAQLVVFQVLTAASQGEIAPAEAVRIARRVRSRLRAVRRAEAMRRRAERLTRRLG